MEEGEPGDARKKCPDRGTRVEARLVGPPRLQRRAGHRKHPGRLTLGDTFGLQRMVLRQQLCACEAIPALGALLVASLRLLDSRSHSDLLLPSCALAFVMAKDGEVACWFQPFAGSSHGLSGSVLEAKWPTR